jgi:hypothetical protein
MMYRTILFLIGMGVLAGLLPAAAQSVTVPIGDTLPLSGLAPGADTVYLYLTGPNLPPNGVKLDDISVAVITGVPSTFVQVPVSADGRWEYSWNTRTNGGLDLSGRDSYAVIAVTLTPPTLTAGFEGGLTITSEPSGAGVRVDGEPKGSTPLDLTNVSAGEHTVEIAKEGYVPAIVDATVDDGQNTMITQTLVLETTPVQSAPPATPPVTSIPFPLLVPFLALGAGLQLLSVRRK